MPLRFPDGAGGFLPPWNTDEAGARLVLLPAQTTLLPNGAPDPAYLPGGGSSLPDSLTLSDAEIAAVEQEVADYNAIIAREVGARASWVLADMNAELAGLPNDALDPATYAVLNAAYPLQPDLINGGLFQNTQSAFSLDGIHPSEKGYAQTANVFLTAMNSGFGQGFSLMDVGSVTNVAGFEQFDVPVPGAMHIDESAARVLRDLPRALGAR